MEEPSSRCTLYEISARLNHFRMTSIKSCGAFPFSRRKSKDMTKSGEARLPNLASFQSWRLYHLRIFFLVLILSRPGVHFVPPSHKSQHKRLGVWRLLLCNFSLYVYSIQKSSVPPISPHVCCHGNHAFFGLFLKTQVSIVFKYFRLRETFCWITFYALDIIIV